METHTNPTDHRIHLLRQQISQTESHLATLKSQLSLAESQAHQSRQAHDAYLGGLPAEWIDETLSVLHQNDPSIPNIAQSIRQEHGFHSSPSASNVTRHRWPLEASEYRRYGRQLIMPEVGLHGQLRLKAGKVLIVGMGGLGCPAAAYLAGAGVGTIGLVDGDVVEESNLHRQVVHSTGRVGMKKVDSAWEFLVALNPEVEYRRHPYHLTPETAVTVAEEYDLVLDCTDHPTSRYLISDACVLAGKPLVSASALKTEGQLIILNNPPRAPGDDSGGPCYRCIFPKPPPPETLLTCGEGGILGPVVGTMGVLQALEALKIVASPSQALFPSDTAPKPTLLMFSAYGNPQFRSVRMRSRRPACSACSSQATINRQSLLSGSLDYVAFCGGATQGTEVLSPDFRISATEFARLPRDGSNMLIDVRDETQYAICALRGSINVPWTGSAEAWVQEAMRQEVLDDADVRDKFIVCRLGNDSQFVAKAIMERYPVLVRDIRGGFQSWRKEVDPGWPEY